MTKPLTRPLDRQRWSPEEDALLARLRAENVSYAEISKKHLPHRSVRSIELRALTGVHESFDWERADRAKLIEANRQFVKAVNKLREKVARRQATGARA